MAEPDDSLTLIDIKEMRLIRRYELKSQKGLRNISRLMNTEGLDQGNIEKPLGRTVADAIAVSRGLGIRYLWVDRLCICQDDENETRSQISQMDRIFGDADVTIVAADGGDVDFGLAGSTTPRVHDQLARNINDVVVMLPIRYQTHLGLWDTRGWTMQEKLLSPRLLVFSGGYVSIYCQHGVYREDMSADQAGDVMPQITPIERLVEREEQSWSLTRCWDESFKISSSLFFCKFSRLLEEYTGRTMTRSEDILSGVQGLFNVLETLRKDQPHGLLQDGLSTISGIPEEYLDLCILWQPPASRNTNLTRRITNERFPSWSWSGWQTGCSPSMTDAGSRVLRPGIRFDEPFSVFTNDDGSLRKVLANNSTVEERMRPLLMWYKPRDTPKKTSSPFPSQRTEKVDGLARTFTDSVITKSHFAPTEFSRSRTIAAKVSTQTKEPTLSAGNTSSNPQNGTVSSTTTITNGHHGPSPEQMGQDVVPFNGHGLGIAIEHAEDREQFLKSAFHGINTPVLVPFDLEPSRHLLCQTQVAPFRIGTLEHKATTIWRRIEKGLREPARQDYRVGTILDSEGKVVGEVIPANQQSEHIGGEFIVLSEAQYIGNEINVDIVGFPLYNVMLVEIQSSVPDRYKCVQRVGLGKIRKDAWWRTQEKPPRLEMIILQ
ncbi:putative Heterokaryon incompatibility domain-containing protein [Seiridium unicorne]|uniref:Heterokaryon incompatibility domain-containing protein n=1 Tax=Seiridium unicorne TaxID=138068 RepID=A0ABR2V6Q7_9PEZI